MTCVAATSDGKTPREEYDDGGWQVVAEDDHRGLVDVNVVEVIIITEGHLGNHRKRMCLLHQEGGKREKQPHEPDGDLPLTTAAEMATNGDDSTGGGGSRGDGKADDN